MQPKRNSMHVYDPVTFYQVQATGNAPVNISYQAAMLRTDPFTAVLADIDGDGCPWPGPDVYVFIALHPHIATRIVHAVVCLVVLEILKLRA
jgi:hypothetical protein